jgi:hypothetical protein
MKNFRFSPIKDRKTLIDAINYVHFTCFKLCKQVLGEYLPNAGNIGIFCHYDEEFSFLTKVREELTIKTENINKKYYKLHKPIIIPAKGDIPQTTYTHLYIRKPEIDHPNVGDVDFYLEPEEYANLKNSLMQGRHIKDAKIFERPDLDLIKFFDPEVDVSSYVGSIKYNQV